MFEKTLLDLRDFCVRNFFVNVVGFKKKNFYIWLINKNFINFIIYFILLCVPFTFTKIVCDKFDYDIIYSYDSIYQITNTKTTHMIPILLEFKVYNTNNPDYLYDLTYQIKYYNSSLPLNVFSVLNIPETYNTIKLKYLEKGKIKDKNIRINEYKNSLIYKLFEN